MAHITLSIPDKLYKEMRKHPEIKWSEVARECLTKKIMQMKKVTSASELRAHIDPIILESLDKISEKKAKQLYKKMVAEEWQHLKSLIRVS